MQFEQYVRALYGEACRQLESEALDRPLIDALKTNGATAKQVVEWMTRYNIVQGIDDGTRLKAARAFLKYARGKRPKRLLTAAAVKREFSALHGALHRAKQRGWTSATSKLLWLLYPRDVAMYDEFVYQSLVVIQGVDTEWRAQTRIGEKPGFGKGIARAKALGYATEHYVCAWTLIRSLMARQELVLQELRQAQRRRYPYDIRIIDRLLWMLGNAKHQFS